MTIKLGVVMDSIQHIKIAKDTTFAMLLEAQRRSWTLFYMERKDLLLEDGVAFGSMRNIKVYDDKSHWYELSNQQLINPLHDLDVILMRKDPPVDQEYLYATQLLELAEMAGVLVVNKPQSLRDFNEKLFASWFPQCCPATLVTSDPVKIKQFLQDEQDIICKPLDRMGGQLVFRIKKNDPNVNVIIETLTNYGSNYLIAQRYISEITQGDKRIILIEGDPVPYALARIPAVGETRANLASGGQGQGVALTERDYWICEQIAPMLRERGILMAGIDVIGDYLTEINITSPTCVRELEAEYDLNICEQLFDCILDKLQG